MADVDETWIKPLRDATSYYNNVMAYTMLEFLRTNSGGLHDIDLPHFQPTCYTTMPPRKAFPSSSWHSSTAVRNWRVVEYQCRMPHYSLQHTRKSWALSTIRRHLASGSDYYQQPKRGWHGKPISTWQTSNGTVSSRLTHSRLVQQITSPT